MLAGMNERDVGADSVLRKFDLTPEMVQEGARVLLQCACFEGHRWTAEDTALEVFRAMVAVVSSDEADACPHTLHDGGPKIYLHIDVRVQQ